MKSFESLLPKLAALYKNGINLDKVGYTSGYVAGFIASFLIPGTQGAKVAKVSASGIPVSLFEDFAKAMGLARTALVEGTTALADDFMSILRRIKALLNTNVEDLTKLFNRLMDIVVDWFKKGKQLLKSKFTNKLFGNGIYRTSRAKLAKTVDGIVAEIANYEKIIFQYITEHSAIFTKDGEIITGITSGLENKVIFDYKYIIKLWRATVTHNHPQGGSLSPGDIMIFLEHGLKEMRAVCPDGIVFSLKNIGEPFTKTEVDKILKAVNKSMKQFKNLDKELFERVEADLLIDEMQKYLKIEYLRYTIK